MEAKQLALITVLGWLGSIAFFFIIYNVLVLINTNQKKWIIRLNIIFIGVLLLLLLPIEPILYICHLFWRRCYQCMKQEQRDNFHEMFKLGLVAVSGIILMIVTQELLQNMQPQFIYHIILYIGIAVFIIGYMIPVCFVTKHDKIGFYKTEGGCCAGCVVGAPWTIIFSISLIPIYVIIFLSDTHDFVVECMNKINASFVDFDVVHNKAHQKFWSVNRIYDIENNANHHCNISELICGLFGWITYFPITFISAIAYGIATISKDTFIFPNIMVVIPTITSLTLLIATILFWTIGEEIYINIIWILSLIVLSISSIFLGILYYHIHEGTFTSNNIVLIFGLFIIAPVRLLFLQFWPNTLLQISRYFWDSISINFQKAIGIYEFSPQHNQLLPKNDIDDVSDVRSRRMLSDSVSAVQNDLEKAGEKSHASLISLHIPGATRSRYDNIDPSVFAWKVLQLFVTIPFIIVAYILLPINYLIQPMNQFRFQCFIIPFSFSISFWFCFIFWIFGTNDTQTWILGTNDTIFLVLWIFCLVFLFLLSIREDPKLQKKLSNHILRIVFPFMFTTYIISGPCAILGIFFWPKFMVNQAHQCYKIVVQQKITSDALPYKFWKEKLLFVIKNINLKICALMLFIILCPLSLVMLFIWFVSIPTRAIIRLPIIYWIITMIMSLSFWCSIVLSIMFDPLKKGHEYKLEEPKYWIEYGILIALILGYIITFAVILTSTNFHDHSMVKCVKRVRTMIGILLFGPTICGIGYYASWYYLLFVYALS